MAFIGPLFQRVTFSINVGEFDYDSFDEKEELNSISYEIKKLLAKAENIKKEQDFQRVASSVLSNFVFQCMQIFSPRIQGYFYFQTSQFFLTHLVFELFSFYDDWLVTRDVIFMLITTTTSSD